MTSNWSMLAFEILITGGVLALAVRELIILRRDERRAQRKEAAGDPDEQAR